ncbi:type II toxin-antitoxin system VapC family toxin [Reyranella sp. CPCC 100927]|uniref:type II toxin-antitoxin system VapC family toxin n=1 Tax=Reyranella sp. CPCC 100927 TaxID=2599616 RepID=UPI0011B4A6FC|nr:type II toxin-antitoxin system VapC family toxin [Reyranella sp. CPCC 100927]TWS94122.1 type II toxin-antitoxin system VapC family toxin [Reyranella sp. CPCC 100927]
MPILLDTHALIWWSIDAPQLSQSVAEAIRTEEVIYVSAASAFEIATKYRLGKLPQVERIVADLGSYVAAQGFHELPISIQHAQTAGTLPGPSRDPFDRLLIAQAMVEALPLVSIEQPFDAYPIRRLW